MAAALQRLVQIPKTLRWARWHTPARLVCRARQVVVRVLDGWPTTDQVLGAYRRIVPIA